MMKRDDSIQPEATLRRGEKAISEATLEVVSNPTPGRDYKISISYPEFTCLCPRTGYPDFATIRIVYVPDLGIYELRALKLYLNRFRDKYVFHEAVINDILSELIEAANPRYIRIVGDFNVRGNVKTIVTVVHKRDDYDGPSPLLRIDSED